MFIKEDTTYNDIRERSVRQWLDEMGNHEDIEVRGGTRVTSDYIDYLKQQINNLENQNRLKDTYLKKLKGKNG